MSDYYQNYVGLGAVTDIITIGGKQYSVDVILDKPLIAYSDTPVYRATDFQTPAWTVKKGQSIGMVYSYIKPSAVNGGRTLLMFYDSFGKAYYAAGDTIDKSVLRDVGVLTLEEQVQEEQERREKLENPIEYYVKKYAWKVLLIGGGIYLAAEFGKQFIKTGLTEGGKQIMKKAA